MLDWMLSWISLSRLCRHVANRKDAFQAEWQAIYGYSTGLPLPPRKRVGFPAPAVADLDELRQLQDSITPEDDAFLHPTEAMKRPATAVPPGTMAWEGEEPSVPSPPPEANVFDLETHNKRVADYLEAERLHRTEEEAKAELPRCANCGMIHCMCYNNEEEPL